MSSRKSKLGKMTRAQSVSRGRKKKHGINSEQEQQQETPSRRVAASQPAPAKHQSVEMVATEPEDVEFAAAEPVAEATYTLPEPDEQQQHQETLCGRVPAAQPASAKQQLAEMVATEPVDVEMAAAEEEYGENIAALEAAEASVTSDSDSDEESVKLQMEHTMCIVYSQRGAEQLCIDGYMYYQNKKIW